MNSTPRFFLPPEHWQQGPTTLDPEESRHCHQVLRLRPGACIEVFDGNGKAANAELLSTDRHACQVQLAHSKSSPPPAVKLALAIAIPKGKTMDLIVQKACELGIQHLQPLLTTHTVVNLSAAEASKKVAKWQRVALEACKQCGQNHLPTIATPTDLQAWLGALPQPSAARPLPPPGLIASLVPGSTSLAQGIHHWQQAHSPATVPGTPTTPSPAPPTCWALIGPEGDFSPAETQLALKAHFLPVTLGPIVLRVETAALYLLSILNHQLLTPLYLPKI